MATSIASLFVSIGANATELEKELKKTEKQVQKFGKNLTSIGKGMTATITAPIVGLGAAAFAAANEVDKANKIIRAGTGATGDALKALGEDFKAVFRQVPQDAETVGAALADLNTRTGATGKALQDLTKQMLDLSRVSGDDVGALVASTTRVFGDWSIATEKQAQTLDYLWKVSQNTGIGVDALAQKVVQFGAPLRQMGFDFETSAALMGKWEKEGVNLELVMGSLRQGLGKFAKAGEEAPAAFRRVVKEIQNMESASQATALAMEIFGARAGPDMAAAIREGRFEIDELLAAIQGSPETIAAAARETLTFGESMQMLKNEATIALEPLGRVLLDLFMESKPMIEDVIGSIIKLTEWFGNLDPRMQKLIVGGLALTAALGPVAMALGAIITTSSKLITIGVKFVDMFGKKEKAASKLAPVLTRLGGPVIGRLAPALLGLTGPFGAVVLAITGLITVGKLLIDNWDAIKNKAKDMGGAMDNYYSKVYANYGAPPKVSATVSNVADLRGLDTGNVAKASTLGDFKKLNQFATGGIVPGPMGAPQLAVVHGGEEVLTPQQRGGKGGIVININGPISSRQDADTIANQIIRKLRLAGVTP